MAGKPVRISILADSKEFETAMDRSAASASDFGKSMDKAGAKVEKLDSKFEGVGEGADTVASKGAQAAGALSGLGDTIGGPFGSAMAGAGLAMQTAADSGDLLNAAIEGGGKLIGKAKDAFGAMAKATKLSTLATKAQSIAQGALNAVMDANPIFLVVAAVAALVAGFVIAYKKSETFRDIVKAAFNAIKIAAQAVADFFTKDIPAAFDWCVKKVQAFWSQFGGLIKTWGPVILALFAPIIGIPLLIWQHWSQITSFVSSTWNSAIGWLKGVPSKVTGVFKDAGTWLTSAGSKIVQGLWSGLRAWWNTNVQIGTWLLGKLTSGLSKAGSWLTNTGGSIIHGAWSGLTAWWSANVAIGTWLKGKVTSGLSKAGTWLYDSGKDLITGLWNGVTDTLSGAGKWAVSLADKIGSAIKNALNDWLHLPIKVPRFNTHIPGIGTIGGETLIPRLASGGITTGPTLALIGDNPGGREAVIPLDKYDMGGNITINLSGTFIGSTKADIGRWVQDALDSYRTAGGRAYAR